MAVLVEAISVVVRRDSIDRTFDGGWTGFVSCVPNATLCTDSQLARVGFMDPGAVGKFVESLQAAGLVFVQSGKCTDLVVVDHSSEGQQCPAIGWSSRTSRSVSPGERSLLAGFLRDRG